MEIAGGREDWSKRVNVQIARLSRKEKENEGRFTKMLLKNNEN